MSEMRKTFGVATFGKQATALLLTFVMLFSAIGFVTPSNRAYADANEAANYKFSLVAAAAAVYCDNLFLTNNFTALDDSFEHGNYGNAGGLLGYVDENLVYDSEKYSFSFFSSANTLSSSSYSYAAFEQGTVADSATGKALDAYARYGWALKEIGFDGTTASSNNPLRTLGGYALYGSYEAAKAAENIFNWCVTGLARINPFAFMSAAPPSDMQGRPDNVVGAYEDDKRLQDVKYPDDQIITAETGDAENNLVTTLSGIYNYTRYLGMKIMVPLFFALLIWLTVIGKAVFGSKLNLTRIRNFVVRATFIVLGIPLLAITYTGALNTMLAEINSEDKTDAQSVDYVVLGSLVNFENWAKSSNLAWPDAGDGSALKLEKNGSTYYVSNDTMAQLRRVAVQINKDSYGSVLGYLSASDITTSASGVNSAFDFGLTRDPDKASSPKTDDAEDSETICRQLLSQYAAGTKYSAANYESYAKQLLGEKTPDGGQKGDALAALNEWIRAAQNPKNYASTYNSTAQMAVNVGGGQTPWKGEDAGLFNDKALLPSDNGNLDAEKESLAERIDKALSAVGTDGDIDWTTPAGQDALKEIYKAYYAEKEAKEHNVSKDKYDELMGLIEWLHDGKATATVSTGDDASILYTASGSGEQGLSTLAMYNYLSTDFTDGGLMLYSDAAPNEYSRSYHYSVNAFGGGLYGALILANAVSVLLLMALMGIVYGIGLLFSNLKRGFGLIVSTPFAMLGMIQSIARVILLGITMIVEVFAICTLYFMLRGLIWSVDSWFISLAPEIFSAMNIDPSAITMGGIIASIVIGTIAMIALMVLILKTRKAVVGGLSDLVSSLVNRLIGASGGDNKEANVAGMVGKGVAGGMVVSKTAGSVLAPAAALTAGGLAANAAIGAGGIGGDAVSDANASGAQLPGGTNKNGVERESNTIEGDGRQAGWGAIGGDADAYQTQAMTDAAAAERMMEREGMADDTASDASASANAEGSSAMADSSADGLATDGGMASSLGTATASSDAYGGPMSAASYAMSDSESDAFGAAQGGDNALYSDGSVGQSLGQSIANANANSQADGASAMAQEQSLNAQSHEMAGQPGMTAASLSGENASAMSAQMSALAAAGANTAARNGFNPSAFSDKQLAAAQLAGERAYAGAKADGANEVGAGIAGDNAATAALNAMSNADASEADLRASLNASNSAAAYGLGGDASADAVRGFDGDREMQFASEDEDAAAEAGLPENEIQADSNPQVDVQSDSFGDMGESIAHADGFTGRVEGGYDREMALSGDVDANVSGESASATASSDSESSAFETGAAAPQTSNENLQFASTSDGSGSSSSGGGVIEGGQRGFDGRPGSTGSYGSRGTLQDAGFGQARMAGAADGASGSPGYTGGSVEQGRVGSASASAHRGFSTQNSLAGSSYGSGMSGSASRFNQSVATARSAQASGTFGAGRPGVRSTGMGMAARPTGGGGAIESPSPAPDVNIPTTNRELGSYGSHRA